MESKIIKFRAWDEKGTMIYGVEHANPYWSGQDCGGDPITRYEIDGFNDYLADPNRYTIEPYTGVDDKGCIGIYEGDLIYDEISEAEGEVTFADGGFFVGLGNVSFPIGELNQNEIQVVGNIHEGRTDKQREEPNNG